MERSLKFFQHDPTSQPLQTSQPKSNVFFMKTHKTGSTTLQNILERYADQNDLHIGLSLSPNDPRFRYSSGDYFRKQFVRAGTSPINMILHHMRFNYIEVKGLMPSDTVFITILREPFSLFQSVFSYLHWNCKSFMRVKNNQEGFATWIENPLR